MSGLYGSRWQRTRAGFLKKHPICEMCRQIARTTAATVVDHIKPHKGDLKLFWDRNNWQALCKHCHDSHKQSQEKTGHIKGNTLSGDPIDPNHHWNG